MSSLLRSRGFYRENAGVCPRSIFIFGDGQLCLTMTG